MPSFNGTGYLICLDRKNTATQKYVLGTGLGVYEQIGMALVNLYFEKRRGIASGIATAGTGAGILVFPPLTNFLFSQYGYQGTCILLAGIALHGVVAGVVIISPDAAVKLSARGKPRDAKTSDYGATKLSTSRSDSVSGSIHTCTTQSVEKLKTSESTGTLAALSQSNKSSDDDTLSKKEKNKDLSTILKSACDLSLFRDYRFVLFALTHSLFSGAFTVPSAFMPARAVSYGISKTNGSLLISAMGLASVITRPFCGILVDWGPIKKRRYFFFVFWITMAGSVTLLDFGETLIAQMSYAVLYGLGTGDEKSAFVAQIHCAAWFYFIISG